ncbi:MAG: cellulose biosynthesis cyclic di-GMP-binding regulatory protein BcsB [Anaerolineae bacterium]|nr:cellulose biosynthesis cyclic di-GMP-binding regulatory protein BcsB [Anaerolineae bacterium]
MKQNIRPYLLSAILGLAFFLGLTLVVSAQEPETTPEDTLPAADTLPPAPLTPAAISPDALEDGLPPILGTAPLPPDGRGVLNLSLADLGLNDFTLATNGRLSIEQSFYLPSYMQVLTGTVLDVDYRYEASAAGSDPEVMVALNETEVGALQLSGTISQTSQTLNLDGLLNVLIRNRLNFSLNSDLECGLNPPEVQSLIYNTSTLRIPYQLQPLQPNLGRYPWPFYERAYRPVESYVVLPANPTPADLSAAATIGAGLGNFARGDVVLTTTLDISVTNDIRQNYNLILIGKPGANRLLDQVTLPLALNNKILKPEYGVIQEVQSPWNPYRMVLVISGQTDTALVRASQALNRNVQFPGMSGPVAVVQDVLPPIPEAGSERQVDLTFADLGLEDQVVFGARPQRLRVDFELPGAFQLVGNSQAVLSFNHSQLVNGTMSSLDVYLNEIPVGTTLLDETNTTDGLLEIDLPAWQLKSGRNRLEIQIEMHLSPEEDPCEVFSDARLWTVIRSNSFIRLPYEAQPVQPTLTLFPYPFDKDINLSDVQLVLPARPNAVELQAMMKLAVNLGQAAGGSYIALAVASADKLAPEALDNYQTILVGRPSRNHLLRAINEQLPQPFTADSDLLEPTLDTVVLLPDPSQNIGLLQEFPYGDSENYVLVISGTTDQGLGWATDLLLTPNAKRGGNVAVIKEGNVVFGLDTRDAEAAPSGEDNSVGQVEPGPLKAGFDVARWLALSQRWW